MTSANVAVAFAIYAVSTLIAMAPMNIGAVLLLGVLLVWFGGPRRLALAVWNECTKPTAKWLFVASLALAVAVVLSLLTAVLWPLSYWGNVAHQRLLFGVAKLWYLFWPFVLAAGLRRLEPANERQVRLSWLIAAGIFALVGILQYFAGWPRPQPIPDLPGRYHVTLFLGFHLAVASIFIFPFFSALDWARSGTNPRRERMIMAIIGCLILVALLLTFSRTLWVALPVGILGWILASLRRRWSVAIVVGLLIAVIGALQLPEVRFRLDQKMGIKTRVALWQTNIEFFKQRPLTGVGFLKNEELAAYYLIEKTGKKEVFSGHAHNNFLNMLAGTGLAGTLAWLGWCTVVFILLIKVGAGTGLICAWIVFHLNGLTQVNFWDAKVTHQMMLSLGWTLTLLGRKRQKYP